MAATYILLKYLHVGCVVLSGAAFVLRGAWMMRGSPMLARRWVRVVPHVVDTALLASAIALALNREPRVRAYVVEAENFESIHNHSAFARVTRPRDHDAIEAY